MGWTVWKYFDHHGRDQNANILGGLACVREAGQGTGPDHYDPRVSTKCPGLWDSCHTWRWPSGTSFSSPLLSIPSLHQWKDLVGLWQWRGSALPPRGSCYQFAFRNKTASVLEADGTVYWLGVRALSEGTPVASVVMR